MHKPIYMDHEEACDTYDRAHFSGRLVLTRAQAFLIIFFRERRCVGDQSEDFKARHRLP